MSNKSFFAALFAMFAVFIVSLAISIPIMISASKKNDIRIEEVMLNAAGKKIKLVSKEGSTIYIIFEEGGYMRVSGRKGITIE